MKILITAATALSLAITDAGVAASQAGQSSSSTSAAAGERDFDWEIGSWKTKVRVRRNALSNEAPQWVEYQGTSLVRPLLGGRANFVELSVKGPAGSIEGGSLRLYNPGARQWGLYYASLRNGLLTAPVYGSFDSGGRGRFYGQDIIDGRAVWIRFLITKVSQDEAHFEQAYSVDGGASWEDNWIAVDTRE